jgi:PPM family protein phosphatase
MTEPTEPQGGSPGRGGTPPPPGPLRLRYAAVSDVGRHRKDNQDSGFASERLLVVADGVGGQAFGDVASSTAVHLLRRLDRAPAPSESAEPAEAPATELSDDTASLDTAAIDTPPADTPPADSAGVRPEAGTEESLSALAGAVHRVHDRLAEMVEQDSELNGTSTTLTAALFDGRALAFAHVGDSRAYLLRGGELQRLTTDHTFVQTLIDEGRITEEESRVHPHRNIIMRAVDGVHEADPDLFTVPVEPGDRLLLCSDGCSGVLDDDELAALLREGSVDFAAVELVRASLEAGSTDNVTVVAVEVVDAAAVDDPEAAAGAVGPMLVGAAATQPRRGMLSRIPFRHRQHDTGELDPVTEEVDPEELRYAPRAPVRRRGLRRALLILLPLLLLIAAAGAGYSWTQGQYYVAADGPQVAVYKGVQMDLPGVPLSEVYETSPLRLEDLTDYGRERVERGIVAESLDDARGIVSNLQEDAREKAAAECPTPAPTGRPGGGRSPAPDQRSPDADAGTGQAAAECPTPDGPRSSPGASPTADATGGGARG